MQADLLFEPQDLGHRQLSLPNVLDGFHKESSMCALLGHKADDVDRVHSVADFELV